MSFRITVLAKTIGAALLCVAAISTPAVAQQRVLVTDFTHDDGSLRDSISEELVFRNDYDLADTADFQDEVNSFDMSIDEFLEDPGLVQEVCDSFGIEAVVYGRLDRSRRARELILTVYEGATGLELGSVSVELRSGRADSESLDWGLAEIESYVSWAAPLEPQTPPPRDPPPRRRTEPTAPLNIVSEPATESAQWLWVSAGLDATQRSFTLIAPDRSGIQYESGFKLGVEGILEARPVAAFAPGVLDGLALRFRVARYFVETLLLIEDESILNIPTRHKEFGATLRYNHSMGNLTLLGWVGYEKVAYLLGANEVYESSEYSGIAIGAGASYEIVSGLLSLGATGEVRPSPSLGEAERIAFGEGDALGFGFGGEVILSPIDALEIAGFYNFRHFSTTFAGGGESELEGALEASDTYQHFGGRVSYVY